MSLVVVWLFPAFCSHMFPFKQTMPHALRKPVMVFWSYIFFCAREFRNRLSVSKYLYFGGQEHLWFWWYFFKGGGEKSKYIKKNQFVARYLRKLYYVVIVTIYCCVFFVFWSPDKCGALVGYHIFKRHQNFGFWWPFSSFMLFEI